MLDDENTPAVPDDQPQATAPADHGLADPGRDEGSREESHPDERSPDEGGPRQAAPADAAADSSTPGPDPDGSGEGATPPAGRARKGAAKRAPAKRATKKAVASAAAPPASSDDATPGRADQTPASADRPAGKRATARRGARKSTSPEDATTPAAEEDARPTRKRTAAKRSTSRGATTRTTEAATDRSDASEPGETAPSGPPADAGVDSGLDPGLDAGPGSRLEAGLDPGLDRGADSQAAPAPMPEREEAAAQAPAPVVVTPLFQPPAALLPAPPQAAASPGGGDPQVAGEPAGGAVDDEAVEDHGEPPAPLPEADGLEEVSEETDEDGDEQSGEAGPRRRRRRGGRRRRKGGDADPEDREGDEAGPPVDAGAEAAVRAGAAGREEPAGDGAGADEGSATTRRRRRRRRAGELADGSEDDPQNTVTRVRQARRPEDEITGLTGSTRLEAKKQRRREGREAGRRRAPVISEAEFLARREAVERVMVIRQRDDLTQIAVLEDQVLVEHYVARESQTSLIGNVYLGRVQNVLPSMEAAFIDIGKGRNAVLYAGEVNWEALGAKNGSARKIEAVLKPGQAVLVQVTKDPVGHKGARLTSQVSLPGRFLVYVPDGTTSGISRKLPDTERSRLKALLKEIVPDTAGVIVRTAAEGASEEELTRDVQRLTARWADIEAKVAGGTSPQLLYGEPDLTLKVVRDLFTEDFATLVVSGEDAWETVKQYVEHVAPDLADRLERFEAAGDEDAFTAYRVDEQIAKGLDRKVWLPSGGSLVIDRTEAMTVVDVNTGKFTGSGGNLEETVTKNNLEAAEEIVRQLRLRDIGGIIVVDFIDMVLESNRELVLRRLVECLGRDRTRHQVAEVTSLGLVQMTRKRIGTGLLEAFSEPCEACQGRGLVVHQHPVETKRRVEEDRTPRRGRGRGGRGRSDEPAAAVVRVPTPADLAAMARHDDQAAHGPAEPSAEPGTPEDTQADIPAAGTDGSALGPPDAPTDPAPAGTVQPDRSDPVAADAAAGLPGAVPDAVTETVPDGRGAERAAVQDVATPEPAAPEPVAPRIITSIRRRGVTRAAGPPAVVAPQVAEGEVTADRPDAETDGLRGETTAPSYAEPRPGDPAATDGEPAHRDLVAADPTGEGREVADRHEGDDEADRALEDPNAAPPGEDDAELVDASWVHVPIKKKGSRKR